jgi:8-oxo-dGTP diphosphatase
MSPEIPEIYSNRTRVRVCGLCWQSEKLLMVNHRGLTAGNFWSPVGGGIEFGETAADALVREFQEETGITIQAERLLFVCEYIEQIKASGQSRIHAVELFFEAGYLSGEPVTGGDPETDPEHQIITDVKFMSLKEILAVPEAERHGIFKHVKTAGELKTLTGFYRI